jgi:hypothetical protein
MSFIGRAAVWTHVSSAQDALDDDRSSRMPGPTAWRFTPLNVMTGSRIAASGNGVVRWVGGQTWDEVVYAQRVGPRLADQLRRPYLHIVEVLSRHTNRAQEPRLCPRCGQAPHHDWGREYERLVCMEITAA